MSSKHAGFIQFFVARQEGFEPPAHGLEGRCSIQLSYWRAYWCVYFECGTLSICVQKRKQFKITKMIFLYLQAQ